jgi:hypothetical protein
MAREVDGSTTVSGAVRKFIVPAIACQQIHARRQSDSFMTRRSSLALDNHSSLIQNLPSIHEEHD